MKRFLLIFFLLAAAAVAYVYFFEPETWRRLTGDETDSAAPASTERTPTPREASSETTAPEPAAPERRNARIALPSDAGAWYVNGVAHQAGELVTAPAGESVVAVYNAGRYALQTLKAEADATAAPELKLSEARPIPGWDGFQGNRARTGFTTARDRAALTLQWTAELGDESASSPVVQDNVAYLSSDGSLLTAVDLGDGAVLWREGSLGSNVSPVVIEDYAFAGNDAGDLGGYRIKDGKRRGFTSLGSYPTSLALISEDAFLATTRDQTVYSIKTKRSFIGRLPLRVNWERRLEQLGEANATPVIAGDRAVLVTESMGLTALSLETGETLWPKDTAQTGNTGMQGQMTLAFADEERFLTPTPAIDGGTVYAFHDGALIAVRLSDGAELWRRPLRVKPTSSLSLAYGMVYFGDADGRIQARAFDGGALVFAAKIGERPIFASPVIFKDKLLAATGEGAVVLLHCFSGETLAEDRTLAGAPIESTPAATDQAILAINRAGKMAAYQ